MRKSCFILFILFIFSVHSQTRKDNPQTIADKISGTTREKIYAFGALKKIYKKDTAAARFFLDCAWREAKDSEADSLVYAVRAMYLDFNQENGKMNDAYTTVLEMIQLAEKSNNCALIADAYYRMGHLFRLLDMMPKAVLYQERAVQYFKHCKKTSKTNWHIYLLAYYCSQAGKSETALRLFRDAYERNTRENKPDQWLSSETMGWIANSYAAIGKPDSAAMFRRKSIDLAIAQKDTFMIAEGLRYFGSLHEKLGRHDSALNCFKKSLELFEHTRNLPRQGLLNYLIATYYSDRGEHNAARVVLDQYFKHSSHFSKDAETYLLALSVAGKVYKTCGDYKRSADLLTLYLHMKDSVENADERSVVLEHEITSSYDALRHKKELMDHKRELASVRENEKKELILFFTVGALSVCIFVVIMSIRAYRRSAKTGRLLTQQKKIIEAKNSEMVQSLKYAQRIQLALFASEDTLKRAFRFLRGNAGEDSAFIFFKPKDIVSGDFYWAVHKMTMENESLTHRIFICSGDSTGHGIPGAFMSLLNISFLNEAVNEKAIYDPAQIFEFVKRKLIETVSSESQKDGMDACIVEIQIGGRNNQPGAERKTLLKYAAAYNPPLFYSDGIVKVLPYDHIPVGFSERELYFKTHTVEFRQGDSFYLLTDGFQDQFSAATKKKIYAQEARSFFAISLRRKHGSSASSS